MEWTNEQLDAIEARGANVLLSAAAGSGKTTVLVERVLQLVRSGASIDRMLIVTFTRAASADMRAKLSRELGKAAERDGRMREQQLLLERASISTLHAFCSEFLRSHFERADVNPAFRVLDDAEVRRLRDEALDAAIEEAYADENNAKLLLLDYARGPKKVRDMADILLRALEEQPDPEEWVARICSDEPEVREGWLQLWTGELKDAARRDIDRACMLTRLAISTALAIPDCNENCVPALEADLANLERIAALEDYSELYRQLHDFKQTSIKRQTGRSTPDEVQDLRKKVVATLNGISLKQLELGQARRDVEALLPEFEALCAVTLRAQALFEESKDDIAGLSYADLEHRTLRALKNEGVAQELRERYDYIFVDEYQDTSAVQEALVSRIAGGDNLFMVGDVKQSIYRFRQADPGLFLEKYARYGENDGGRLLSLTQNFRSCPAILDFVNHIFARAMYGRESEIVYDQRARLNHGNAKLTGGDVEIHLLEAPDKANADADLLEMIACEREALFIAHRIKQLRAENPELKFRDFAVLTRTKDKVMGRMATVLLQQGIPAFADGAEAFYTSVEILLALSLLKLTANRRSDVELIGVLRSPVVGLDVEQLARIRIAAPGVPFVDAAAACAQGEGDAARQLREFFELLERWQLLALCTDLGALTRTILDESGLYDCMGALPGGPQRQANLDRLVDNAAKFDQNVSGALTRFLRHTEKLRAQGSDDVAHLLGENDDVVRLMTIHKSKGLEFPVVFGAMLDHGYNTSSRGELSAHRKLGLGCAYCDPALKSRRKTLPQLAIAEGVTREVQAEELRLLYVMLTRAQYRLVLTGSVKKLDKAWARWAALQNSPGAAGNYLDVIMPSLDENGSGLCAITEHEGGFTPEDGEELADIDALPDAPDPELLRAIRWTYPEADTAHQPLKVSVTGLLKEIQSPDALEPLAERPRFLSESAARLHGAERGTAYHRAMELLNLEALRELRGSALRAAITAQLDSMAEARLLRPIQREAVQSGHIAKFLEGDVGQRLLHSTEVHREWSFNIKSLISEVLTIEEARGFDKEEILVQGTIDCCFKDGGRWVLLDYKTDRVTDEKALTPRYRNQLRLYAAALNRITGVDVAEIRLCLLNTGEALHVQMTAEADSEDAN